MIKEIRDMLGSAAATVDVSGASTASEAFKLHARGYGVQGHWSGGSAGTVKLQGTAFEEGYADLDPANRWADIADTSVDMAVSTTGYLWNVYESYYSHVRIVFTTLTGTYAVRVILIEKEVY